MMTDGYDDDDVDDYYDEDMETDEPVPGWFKVIVSLVLFSPFIAGITYIILR